MIRRLLGIFYITYGIIAVLTTSINSKTHDNPVEKSKSSEALEDSSIRYGSDAEKERKLSALRHELNQKNKDKEVIDTLSDGVDNQKQQLINEEVKLRKNVYRAALDYGDDSLEKANALHALGRVIYKQGKFQDLVDTAEEILRIHEEVDGPESLKVAQALGNVGSVSFRLGNIDKCQIAMNRALFILNKEYGKNSKEVLMHRAKMLTFKLEADEDSTGMSYKQYKRKYKQNSKPKSLENEL